MQTRLGFRRALTGEADTDAKMDDANTHRNSSTQFEVILMCAWQVNVNINNSHTEKFQTLVRPAGFWVIGFFSLVVLLRPQFVCVRV